MSYRFALESDPGLFFQDFGIPMPTGEWVPEANELKPALGQRITGFTAVLAVSTQLLVRGKRIR
jgi:hypothetical protein